MLLRRLPFTHCDKATAEASTWSGHSGHRASCRRESIELATVGPPRARRLVSTSRPMDCRLLRREAIERLKVAADLLFFFRGEVAAARKSLELGTVGVRVGVEA